MNIILITDDYLPHRGGSRVVYHNIYGRMPAGSVRVLTRFRKGCRLFDAGAGYVIKRVRVPLFRFWEKIGLTDCALLVPLLFRAAVMIARHRPESIHCGEALPSGLAGYFFGVLFGLPCVIWIHDSPFGASSRVRSRLRRFLLRRADGVIAACRYARDRAVEGGVEPEKIRVITPGVDHVVFSPGPVSQAVIERHGLAGKKVLLTIARLLPHKGQDMMIRILPRLLTRHPEIVYLIGGTGPCRASLEALAREGGVENHVIFAGFIPQDEVVEYYRACDLFVMLNREVDGVSLEGFGIVFLEAAACGKPVIAGNRGGVRDSVIDGMTGFLMEPENEEQIFEKINLLLTDKALSERMGSAATRFARTGFDWNKKAMEVRSIGALGYDPGN